MEVLFTSTDADGAQLRPLAVRRVRFALRRLSWLVPRVRLHLADINGPRGGVDKRCRIELGAKGAPPVLVTSVARDWRTAIDEAVGRSARALLRAWRRGRGRHGTNPVAALAWAKESGR
jgi:hypothetical protein